MVVPDNDEWKKSLFPRLSDEQRHVYECLKIEIIRDIQAGLNAFQRAGKKLIRIRDERLYQEEYSSFEDFCRATLGSPRPTLIMLFRVTN